MAQADAAGMAGMADVADVVDAADVEAETDTVHAAEAGQGGRGRRRASGPGARSGRVRRTLRRALRPGPWRRGLVLAASALLLGLLMLLHARIPDRGGIGSLVETFLPWFGLFVPVLLAGALWRRSASAVVALVLPVAVWLNLFGGLLVDKSRPGGDLTLATHNVGADNPDPAGTARDLAASGADVLALEEITPQAKPVYERELAKAYPHHTVRGTVGLWSRLPLSDTRAVDIQQDVGPLADTKPVAAVAPDGRALRATVATDQGPLAVYVAHLGSVRVYSDGFTTGSRDRNARALGAAVAAEPNKRMVLLGDLNGTVDDRALDGVTSRLRSAQDAAGDGFGFTWPRTFPMARIDHVLVRGVTPVSAWVLPATGSDHRPVAAAISW
ncbi:Endonuclease/Exonuclease/phosphatase family protein [Streptomyces sp. YIM 121038]|uniref:endonuclease/exonuclease/phosphatase family protein n=1 Tax=Streptomyces sp. YIM 121038 TaxID=2136401 RepID=UPI00116464FF|nr:endonuclease/exonuclease/phosphatase family protein [Streptomyces sp. YIM 121038]QCX74705.1 Endonuclease/Exonuclease/phosphatase family protein [Streptomyces sp. YIM 121038]